MRDLSPKMVIALATGFGITSFVQKRMDRCPTCHQALATKKAQRRVRLK